MLSKKVLNIPKSSTLQITSKARELKKKGYDVINFAAGEPDFKTPKEVIDEMYNAIEQDYIYYAPSKGYKELREEICKKYKELYNVDINPEEIIITPGAKQAIFEAVSSIINPGDKVLIPSPCWVSYEPIVKLCDGNVEFVKTIEDEGFRIDMDDLRRKAKNAKLLIINYPNNPTGCSYGYKDLKEIVEICIENDLYIISDEIYDRISFEKHVTMLNFNDIRDKLVVINGFSKTYSMTGFRLGFAIANEKLIDEMSKVQEHTVSCAVSFIQIAAIKALRNCEYFVKQMNYEYRRRMEFISKILDEIGIKYVKPKGTFYIFPKFNINGFKLANTLIEKYHVATIPGEAFGIGGENHLRLSITIPIEKIEEGIRRIEKCLKEMNY